jgi:Ca-activated chloride channel homolog
MRRMPACVATVLVGALIALSGARGQVFNSRARLVEVSATIADRKGNPVDGLGKERFQILDNGKPQEIFSFERDSDDLTVAVLLDTTGSMADALASVKNAVSGFLDEMRPGDSVGVFAFSASLVTLQDFTTDKNAARRAVLRTRAAGNTALFDAIAAVSKELAARPGKKAVVLFTDGADNASQLNADSAIRKVLKTGAPIYAVAEGGARHEPALLKQLKSIAERTGGLSYQAPGPKEVGRIFSDIQAELKHVYLLSYQPPPADDTAWHTIQIAISDGKDFKIRGRQGYFPD